EQLVATVAAQRHFQTGAAGQLADVIAIYYVGTRLIGRVERLVEVGQQVIGGDVFGGVPRFVQGGQLFGVRPLPISLLGKVQRECLDRLMLPASHSGDDNTGVDPAGEKRPQGNVA